MEPFTNPIWQWLTILPATPPPKTTPENQKDEAYHAQWARFYMSQQYAPYRNWYTSWYATNLRYAVDSEDAWGEEDDIRMFLGDEENPTGRTVLKWPLIRPTLTRLTGAVDNVSINAKASSATPQFAKTRKETALGIALLKSQAAQAGPMMAGAYKSSGISPSEEATEAAHDSFYNDSLIRGITSMVNILALKSKLESKKRKTAENMALSGLAAAHCSIHGADLMWELCDPSEIGWDTSALRPDFSDGEYAFVCPQMSVSAIAERWQPKAAVIKALDDFATKAISATQNVGWRGGWPQRRPRVPTVYWKDLKYVERGYVIKDGDLHYCTIGEPDPDTGEIPYTRNDLVDPPKNRWTMMWTESERKDRFQRKAIELVRYCSFIPWEYFPASFVGTSTYNTRDSISNDAKELGIKGDIVFDYGVYPLQEADPDNTYSVEFPIKFSAWSYLSGFVISPIAAAISPQRVMNQVTSDLMWRMSKGGNKGLAFDSDAAIGGSMTEQEVITAIKNGDPVSLKGSINGGVQNSIKEYNASVGAEFYNMFTVLEKLSGIAQASTGVYDQNFGAPGSGDQLVGVKQLQLQQAGVMQQPFYAAIADLYEQIHQFNAQAGKEYYARMPWILSQMVGDTEAAAIEMSKDMTLEQFRIEVKLTPDSEVTRHYVDTELIPLYLQMQLLDPQSASELLGRSLPEDVYAKSREFTKRAAMAARKMQEDQAKQQQMAGLVAQDQMLGQQQHETAMKMSDQALTADQINQKAQAPEVTAAAKAAVEPTTP